MMIHIAGYDADPEEVFEGLSSGGLGVVTTGTGTGTGTGSGTTVTVNPTITATPTVTIVPPGSSLPIAPIKIDDVRDWLEKSLEDSAPLLESLLAYLQDQSAEVVDPNDSEGTRGLRKARAFAFAPILAKVGVFAKGLLPIFKGATALSLVNTVATEVVKDVEDAVDPLDPGWRLYFIEKVLKQALLTPENDSALIQLQSILDRRLSDLAYVDETVDFGFCRVHIKGKMIEY